MEFTAEEEQDEEPVEFSSLELHQEANTEQSRSLLDDMLESSARLYNRNVTRMQLEFRALFQRLIEQTKKQTEEYILDHKNCDREEVVELANAYLRKQREQMLEHLRLAIEKEREERQRRDAKMRQFCEESSPVNS